LSKNSRKEEETMMLRRISIFVQGESKRFGRFVTAAAVTLSLGGSFVLAFAQQPGQQTFASAQDAANALLVAMQSQNEQSPLSVLGPEAKQVLSSGDPMEDADARVDFVVRYQAMHRFVTEANGAVTLVVGAENWPFPIPLVNNHGKWYFDTNAGKGEILFRRVGKNELAAEDACQALVEAQKEYFSRAPAGLSRQFAQKLVSDEGRHDGLYWHGAYDEFDSPISSLIAYAYGTDSKSKVGDPVPFNGYFFRILTGQGPHALGGAKSYIVNGVMTGGFAFIAYPAEYRSSGVMTFLVDESGTIYEKDLGPDTAKIAQAMSAYDPDSSWHQAE
jgi:Protein of unknown function (DUF2950)